MIEESIILLRVQHLEKRARRITVDTPANLVNLVNQHQRVLRPYSLQSLDDLAWQRTVKGSVRATAGRRRGTDPT